MPMNEAIIKLNALRDKVESNCDNCQIVRVEEIDEILEELKNN